MSTQPRYIHVAEINSILAELQKRDENLLAELHHLEWSQSDVRQPSWQLPSSLLPAPKAQTAAWVTATDSQHSNSRDQGKSGENDALREIPHYHLGPTFPTLLSHFQMLLEKTNCSFPQTAATFQFLLTLAQQEPTYWSERRIKQERGSQNEKNCLCGWQGPQGLCHGASLVQSVRGFSLQPLERDQDGHVERETLPCLNLHYLGGVVCIFWHFQHEVTFLCEFFFAVNGFSTSCRESKRYANTPLSRFPLTDRTWGMTFFLPSRPWREKTHIGIHQRLSPKAFCLL